MRTAARRNDGTVNDRRRPRVPAKPKASPQLTGPVQLDDETRNALILFNARLVAQDELEREKRRVDKAAKAKDEAAAKVRELENNPKATAEQKSEAQAAYLASLDALNRAKAGEPIAGDSHRARRRRGRGRERARGRTAEAEAEPEAETPEAESRARGRSRGRHAEAEPEAETPEAEAEPPRPRASPSAEAEAEPPRPRPSPRPRHPEAADEEAPAEAAASAPEAGDEP